MREVNPNTPMEKKVASLREFVDAVRATIEQRKHVPERYNRPKKLTSRTVMWLAENRLWTWVRKIEKSLWIAERHCASGTPVPARTARVVNRAWNTVERYVASIGRLFDALDDPDVLLGVCRKEGMPDPIMMGIMERAGIGFGLPEGRLFFESVLSIADERNFTDRQTWEFAHIRLCQFMKAGGMDVQAVLNGEIQYAVRAEGEDEPITCPYCGEHHDWGGSDGIRTPLCRNHNLRGEAYHVVIHPWVEPVNPPRKTKRCG